MFDFSKDKPSGLGVPRWKVMDNRGDIKEWSIELADMKAELNPCGLAAKAALSLPTPVDGNDSIKTFSIDKS